MDDDDLLNSDIFGRITKPKAGAAAASSSSGSAAAFNPAAIFAPTMKPSGGAKAAKGGGAGKPKEMGLDSLDALLRNAKKREKEVEAVKRNAYQGLGGEVGEEEVEDGELEALEALVKGTSGGADEQSEDGSRGGKGRGKGKGKQRQIFDDEEDEEEEEGAGAGGGKRGSGCGMEKEEVGDWMGLASCFRLTGSSFPSLALSASLPEAQRWGGEARGKLRQALVDAEAKGLLPDLLNLMGPARWLQATDAVAPPGLIDWLWKCLAWHVDPAVSHGAFRTLRMLLRGSEEDGLGPYRKALEGWSLPFSFLQQLLAPYGVQLHPTKPTKKTRGGGKGWGGYATFRGHGGNNQQQQDDSSSSSTAVDTYNLPALGATDLCESANARRAKLQLTPEGIPPIVNLRGLLQCLAWCLRDGLVAWGGGSPQQPADEMMALLFALLVLSTDRYIQADCPTELRGAVAALLHAIPEGSWSASISAAVLDALVPDDGATPPPEDAPVRLGAGSLLHIARAALPALASGRAGDRARALAVALLRRVIEGRVLAPMVGEGAQGASPALGALQALPTQTLPDRQRYLLSLVDSLLNEATPTNAPHGPIPEAIVALAPAGNAFAPPPTKGGRRREEEDGTGLDRVLFLAYALALWTELCLVGRGGQVQGSFPGEAAGKLARLERGKLRNQSEEAVQGAKDVLAQAAASAQALAPKGPTQMTLTAAFARKGSGGAAAESMDIDDD